MDTSFSCDKSSRQSSSLSFITFDKDNWTTISPSFEHVQMDIFAEVESIQDAGEKCPEIFRSLWHEVGFIFSISMSQILTVPLLTRL
jgi:hypothetical protein